MEIWQLYLISIATGTGTFFKGLGAACTVIGILLMAATTLIYGDEGMKEETYNKWLPIARRTLIGGVLCLLVSTLTPTTNSLMWIAGGYVATNIEGVEKLPPNLVDAANTFLESYTAPEQSQ